jgi:hypothetical protein
MGTAPISFAAGLCAGLVPWFSMYVILAFSGCGEDPGGPTCGVLGVGVVLLWLILAAVGGVIGGVVAAGAVPSWRLLASGLVGLGVWALILVAVRAVSTGFAAQVTELATYVVPVTICFLVGFAVTAVVVRARRA